MSDSVLTLMQIEFECIRCGLCCSVGGDMSLTFHDLLVISRSLGCSVDDRTRIPVEPNPDRPGEYRLTLNRPCFFQDKATGLCTIHLSKPQACKDYPFELYRQGGCNLHAAVLCPQAIKQFDELFSVDFRPRDE